VRGAIDQPPPQQYQARFEIVTHIGQAEGRIDAQFAVADPGATIPPMAVEQLPPATPSAAATAIRR
jgi:hypothetical protein